MVCAATKRLAAEQVLHCLQQFGQHQSNPVLQVIAADLPLTENTRYPSQLLQFDQIGLRGYYHCHPQQHRFSGEHGHFHLFITTDSVSEQWSHLVGLCMDSMGQALRWFMVNHWVTGEQWLSAAQLQQQFQQLLNGSGQNINSTSLSLTEQWLLAMLQLYAENITQLLSTRDERLQTLESEWPASEIKANREIYLLTDSVIDLQAQLENCLQADK